MRYKAELDSIPIRVYIDLIAGKDIEFDIPVEEAKKKLMQEYASIVGGKQLLFKVNQQNELMNLHTRLEIVVVADNLSKLGRYKESATILNSLGYSVKKEDKTTIENKCKTLYATFTIKMDKLSAQLKKDDAKQTTNYREVFLRERISLLKHYKVHIDIERVTAAEYAMLLQSMYNEISTQQKNLQNSIVK